MEDRKKNVKPIPNLFVPVYQNRNLNSLAYITSKTFAGINKQEYINSNGLIPIEKNYTKFYFNPAYIAVSYRTQQLLMFYIEKFTHDVPHGATKEVALEYKIIKFTVDELAREFNLTPKQARTMAIKCSLSLQSMVVKWEDKRNGKNMLHTTNILQGFDYYEKDVINPSVKRGEMKVTFADKFAEILPNLYIMWYPTVLRKISPKLYSSANAFGIQISEHFNFRFGTKDENRIKVSLLLDATKDIPEYETVHKNRAVQFGKRIFEPFKRNMDALVRVGFLKEWDLEYETEIIPRDLYKGMRYKKFYACIVNFEINNFPREKKEQSLARVKKRKIASKGTYVSGSDR